MFVGGQRGGMGLLSQRQSIFCTKDILVLVWGIKGNTWLLWPGNTLPLFLILYLLPILQASVLSLKHLWLRPGRTAQPWALAGSAERPFESQGPLVDAQTSIIRGNGGRLWTVFSGVGPR